MKEPFGIYIHWPFCLTKCPYCDFNSHVRSDIDEARFLFAFQREMKTMRTRIKYRNVSSIFIGGGTPSLMMPQTVEELLNTVSTLWNISSKTEITLEANPSSIDQSRFHGYRSAGVNRLSIGVQALDNQELKRLGRRHSKEQALQAITLARSIFPSFSFDIIYARPGQNEKSWYKELEQALHLSGDHLSLYQLSIEEKTPFHHLYTAGKLKIPDHETAANLYLLTQELTHKHRLPAYEISNHAVPGAESKHNLLYWRYQPYVGFGPGAHSRFTENNRKTVTITEKSPELWMKSVENYGNALVQEEYLLPSQEADEMLLMGLRLQEGLNLIAYETLTKKSLSSHTKVNKLEEEGYIEITNNRLRTTIKGRILLNYLIKELASI
ncbi:MAG: oxygen-independent coproporphyrinogen III oxidase [Candidatus Tokpelaia sp. JSC161]|jgi:oxygen-independent coproporphyrinogen-3 oxidase|nr:MAG: oxygen-independent coproporphyrinogen III oxidase [Candidatus Tokpelaia sp. JSC161]